MKKKRKQYTKAQVREYEDKWDEGFKSGVQAEQAINKVLKTNPATIIERCAQAVPTNWCDDLLTGKNAAKLPLNGRGVEALLLAIQDRIRKIEDTP